MGLRCSKCAKEIANQSDGWQCGRIPLHKACSRCNVCGVSVVDAKDVELEWSAYTGPSGVAAIVADKQLAGMWCKRCSTAKLVVRNLCASFVIDVFATGRAEKVPPGADKAVALDTLPELAFSVVLMHPALGKVVLQQGKVAATDKRATFVCIDDAKVDAALRSAQLSAPPRAVVSAPAPSASELAMARMQVQLAHERERNAQQALQQQAQAMNALAAQVGKLQISTTNVNVVNNVAVATSVAQQAPRAAPTVFVTDRTKKTTMFHATRGCSGAEDAITIDTALAQGRKQCSKC